MNPASTGDSIEMDSSSVQNISNAMAQNKTNEKSSKPFFMVMGGLMAFCVLLVVILLPIYLLVLEPNCPESTIIVTSPPIATTPAYNSDWDRFDCYPEGGATEFNCNERGCIWSTDQTDPSAPMCFYSDTNGYTASDATTTPNGFTVDLQTSKNTRANPTFPYGTEFDKLTVTVTRVTNQKLRIKIEPTQEKRFEVPFEHETPITTDDDVLYDITFPKTNGGFFAIKVVRKATGRTIFDTTVGRLSFADQFLQISTLLASQYIYGFGEHMHRNFKHDMNWKSHGMFSRDQGVGYDANLYGVHPFHLCMEGDGNANGVFLLNSNAQDVTLQPTPALTYRTVGGLFDFYIFLGPNPESVVSQYTATIGRPYMPPMWSLGFQLCRYGYGSLDKLKKVVDRMLASEIPYDVQYSDIDYMDRQLDFTINETTYSGIGDFVKDLKTSHQMKYIIIFDPAISGNETMGTYPPWELGVENEVFITTENGEIAYGKVWPDLPGIYVNTSWDWDSQTATFRAHTAFPDFFKESAKKWWSDLTVDFHQRIEFDGLWIDMNEPASFTHGSPDNGCPSTKWDDPLPYFPNILGNGKLYDKTTCMSNLQYHPITKSMDKHYNMHSLYGISQTLPTLEACRESTGERCMVISRSTYPGSGKHSGHWLGDNTSQWHYLHASIIGMLEFNLFGIPYVGADICGFFQDTTEELCMRWTQLGAFYPFARNHNGLGFKDQDPAVFGPNFIAASKKILNVRYTLLPYFYTLFYDAHIDGSTVIRSVMAEFSDDLATYTVDRQFLLGGHILFTPVLDEGRTSVEGYVPNARWYDYYTGIEIPSGSRKKTTYFQAPWDHFPIHIRGGSIIPIQTPAQTTEKQRNNPLGLMYALDEPSKAGSGHLFWDDWDSIDTIENNQYTTLMFHGDQDSLSSHAHYNNYDASDSMIFDHVIVMGIPHENVHNVFVNGVAHHHFSFDSTSKRLHIQGLSLQMTSNWEIVWDCNQYFNRFDCHPDINADEASCVSRGCLWGGVGVPNVPWCYFPENYGMYKKDTAPEATERGEVLYLEKLSQPDWFGSPVQRLKFEVEMQSAHQLRIKISDDANERYEVPMTVHGDESELPEDPLYEVIYQDNPFSFKVVRRSTREVLMDTSVGALIYEDQFLQLTTATASTYMYGLGEAEHENYKHDFYWSTHGMHARDEGVKQDANLYGYHPVHMIVEKSGNAHGMFLHTSNALEVNLTPYPSLTYRTIGGILDFYLFLGPGPEEVTKQYIQAIGLPMMPPYWSLGFQLCKYDYGNIAELKSVVEGMISYDIPYDVQYGDIDYMERQLDFTVDHENYNGLAEFVDIMRNEYKMKYVIILDPAISAEEDSGTYPPWDNGKNDVFIRNEAGDVLFGHVWPALPDNSGPAKVAFPDYFNPITQEWWNDLIVDFYNNELKFDGLWIDMNEPASFQSGSIEGCPHNKYDYPPYITKMSGDSIYNKTICMSSRQYYNDTKEELHYNVHSLYGWSQAEPTLRACQNATGKRCYVISRSTYPGAGKYVGHWLGDNTSKWPHLKSSIIGMFEFGLFGIPYIGADICGFFGDAEEEMCLRWSQLGAFYPFSRNHACIDTRRQDPAAWGPEFAAAVRKVLLTRYTLLPHLYTLFYHSHTTGSTVVRPLMNEFSSDQLTWEVDEQFLWGPNLLISPVLEQGKISVDAYFPDARWFDYYGGAEVAKRGDIVTLQAPKDHINVHVRGGYILPTQEPANTTYFSRQNSFGLIVALDDDNKASGDLYWDDGEQIDSISEKKYFYSKFNCECNVLENRIINDGFGESSNMILGKVIVMGLRDDISRVFLGNDIVSLSSYEQDSFTKQVTIQLDLPLNQEFIIRLEVNNEWSRFDCMPDLLTESNQVDCEKRGCVWQSTTTPNVPTCFFTDKVKHGFDGSAIAGGSGDNSNITYGLERLNTPTLYGDDVNKINFNLQYQTNNRLRMKWYDPSSNRWEVPALPNDVTADVVTANYNVTITEKPFVVKVTRKDNNEVIFDTSLGALIFSDQFLQVSTSVPTLNIYGFGEHNHRRYRHDFNWKRWAIFTRDVAPVDNWNLYGHQTFFMGVGSGGKAYGVYLHNSNAMDVVLQPTPAITYRVIGGILDFYLFMGDSPEQVVQEYQNFIGLPPMPPYWSLGFQLSRWGYGPLDNVKQIVAEMRQSDIPFDVQYGDIDYMDAYKSFTYDNDTYGGLPQFIDDIHSWGMKYVVIIDPGIKVEVGYKAFDEGMTKDIFIKDPTGTKPVLTEVWPGDTYHPDFTNPDVQQWWTDQYMDFYNEQGVKFDAIWIDMNEPANFQPDDPVKFKLMNCTGKYNFPPYFPRILGYWKGMHDKTLCMDNKQILGLHYNTHSLYGHSMSEVTYNTAEALFPDKRSFVITRSNFAGTGKYASHWLGDNQSLWPQMAWSIPAMFEYNLFGFPYVGADICGFWFNTTAEMCQRWMQVGAFYPFSRNHNGFGMRPQHPTAFGYEVESSSRDALRLRYQILPYMYSQFFYVNQNGGTLVRSLSHEFPEDSQTWNIDRQFLLGPAFLVTPVLDQGAVDVTAYFPSSSRWFEFRSGEEVESGKFMLIDAPLNFIPLHIRGGHVMPIQRSGVTTVISRTHNLSAIIALDSDSQASGSLYWDDGESRHVDESYTIINFNCILDTLNITVQHAAQDLPEVNSLYFDNFFIFGLMETGNVTNVVIDGSIIPDGSFTYYQETKKLRISNIGLPITEDHTITWTK